MKMKAFSLAVVVLIVVLTAVIGVATNASAATICTPATAISVPFAKDGAGDFCWQTTTLCSFINSWNLTTLEINGTSYTNMYVAGSAIAPLNGAYIIHYNSPVAWGHFEIGAPCSSGPTNTPTSGASPTRTPTPTAGITNTSTRTPTASPTCPCLTNTPTRTTTAGMTNTPTLTPTRTNTLSITFTPTRTLTPTQVSGTPGVLYVGRFNTSDPAGPRSAWSATTIKANFSGTGISANLVSVGDNWYNVVIDGLVKTPVHAPAGTNGLVTLATGLASGNHTIEFVRRTEAYLGDVQFKGFTVTGGQLLAAPTPSVRRIEFIGDSISAGYGNEGIDQYHSFTPQNENAYLAYGPVTARALGADQFVIAWSGKGVIRNYSGDTTDLMPSLYPRILPYDTTTLWNPSQWVPQVVVINLGTNDFGSGVPDKTAFTTGYSNFVSQIRSQYPNAHIYCALGPLLYDPNLTTARDYITTVVNQRTAAGDTKLHFIEFPQQTGALGYGEDWHPSVAQHAAMAQQLINQIKADLGW
jgi:lysophospholipase L1-like esterase